MLCELNELRNVTPLQLAVADRPGVTMIDNGIGPEVGLFARIGAGENEVEAVTLDQLTAGLDAVDLLKMNIEGGEGLAIQGMRETVEKVRHAAVSCHDFVLEWLPDADPMWFLTYDAVTTFF